MCRRSPRLVQLTLPDGQRISGGLYGAPDRHAYSLRFRRKPLPSPLRDWQALVRQCRRRPLVRPDRFHPATPALFCPVRPAPSGSRRRPLEETPTQRSLTTLSFAPQRIDARHWHPNLSVRPDPDRCMTAFGSISPYGVICIRRIRRLHRRLYSGQNRDRLASAKKKPRFW